ncbi:family 5 hypothetical beta glucosidase from glycoside dehydrogenase [Sistotremastrum suecicum HHB10207 ss-3]|uniref:Family 5 hypothetical beta glucosidase from glycoside dehydrogenase n=1 Tax=Sistotremastrum suecicum HHB10207 ss-3 TaxID=1314776 RepID=A0A166E778_9AGAM|nr:family 5 hypothetical beta glucosidase from glycoside dehydrogenase [Sistotremastrum suecicum HHB10207 ss-3]
MTITLLIAALFSVLSFSRVSASFPDQKIYGVNIGSWLVFEPWMAEQEWKEMGGEQCDDCSLCIRSEWALTKAYPDTADTLFQNHWASWFTQDDVDQLVQAQINTVRIPLGFWIIEPLVDCSTEFYPKGGILHLKRGLQMLRDAGINVILDHHALPGVAAVNQMFAGNCTYQPQFYTSWNYDRALAWTAVMTTLAHLDPDFASVVSIQAANEPIMDANQTPGYGEFQTNFVQVVRSVELLLGITVAGEAHGDLSDVSTSHNINLNTTLSRVSQLSSLNAEVQSALQVALPVLQEMAADYGMGSIFTFSAPSRDPLVTNFMDVNWQYHNPSNPSSAAMGPQAYDNHLYYSFGGVADATESAYLTSICNLGRVAADAAVGNSPLWFGEWALSTQFDASDDFLKKWADAQKLTYSQGAGWLFWNFKIENSDLEGDYPRQWSYFEGLKRGYLTQDPEAMHNPQVCEPYM